MLHSRGLPEVRKIALAPFDVLEVLQARSSRHAHLSQAGETLGTKPTAIGRRLQICRSAIEAMDEHSRLVDAVGGSACSALNLRRANSYKTPDQSCGSGHGKVR